MQVNVTSCYSKSEVPEQLFNALKAIEILAEGTMKVNITEVRLGPGFGLRAVHKLS